MSQEQGRALSVVMMPAEADVSMPNDTSLLFAQWKRQIVERKRRRGFASKSPVTPDFLDEVTVVSTIGRRTK